MRIIALICMLFGVFALSYAASTTWGARTDDSAVILSKKLLLAPIKNKHQIAVFDIPVANSSNSKIITSIYLQDQFKNSSGPINTLLYGGVGLTYASLEVRTLRGAGLNVTCIVYGK
ncbi:PREDICTED: uncharacterized protein LOC108373295 [Rhagoletis zephyria]|uniref:uncharacterized protein LOC108373295 n=1 Tax=Rhagoletis zephyria TaxID=28612 RepID=UPI0008119D23|nr:PREDICTED: uncharacterized protein LOC108373295 [Rhagoletis zephyria]